MLVVLYATDGDTVAVVVESSVVSSIPDERHQGHKLAVLERTVVVEGEILARVHKRGSRNVARVHSALVGLDGTHQRGLGHRRIADGNGTPGTGVEAGDIQQGHAAVSAIQVGIVVGGVRIGVVLVVRLAHQGNDVGTGRDMPAFRTDSLHAFVIPAVVAGQVAGLQAERSFRIVQITVGFDQVEECAQEETVVTVEYDTDQQSQQPQTVTVDFADWNCNNYQFYQVPAQGIETVTYTADTIEWSTDQPNGEPVQVYYSEDGSFVVFDQTCDLAWGVDVKAPAQDNGNPVSNRVAIGHQGRIATELVDSIKAEIRNLETAARLVNGFINTTAEPIRHQLADIDNSLNTARELTGTLLAYKDAHPEESATVNAKIDALNADVAKLKKNRYELVTALNEVTGYISIVRDINRLIS